MAYKTPAVAGFNLDKFDAARKMAKRRNMSF